ncbi:MAG: DnaB-like helicase C-terminal domain-containing protein [Oscillospiraceae bacterium]
MDNEEAIIISEESHEATVAESEEIEEQPEESKEIEEQPEESGDSFGEYKSLSALFDEEFIINNKLEHVPTGFSELDGLLGGGLPVGLTVLGAISSLGKSTLALQMAQNISASGRAVLYFSLEMTDHAIVLKAVQRKAFLKSGMDKSGVRDNAFSMADIMALLNNKNKDKSRSDLLKASIEECAEETQLLFTVLRTAEGGTFTGKKICDYVMKFIETTQEIPVVFVDYLQILSSESPKVFSDKQIVDENIQALWRLANGSVSLPVLVISAINRDAYNKGISFGSFKESGSIEYSADVVLGMQFAALHGKLEDKKFNADEEKGKNPRRLEIVVLKQRYGKAGSDVFSLLDFYPTYNCFIEQSQTERNAFLLKLDAEKEQKASAGKRAKADNNTADAPAPKRRRLATY